MKTTHLVDVVITRFVEDHQPAIVEWTLTDIHGRAWVFEGKCVYVTTEYLDQDSLYPRRGSLDCVLLGVESDETGKPFYRIDTHPEGSIDDANIFDVRHVKPYSLT